MKESWVLILGANSDIATATAKYFARRGYNLQLASRSTDELEKTASDLSIRYAVDVKSLKFDATNFESHKGFYNGLEEKPDGVIVAFGTMYDQEKAQKNFNLSKNTIETNYLGAVSILEIIASDFEARKHGFIASISSVAGDRGRKSNYIYGSSKSALSSYLKGLSHRLADTNISVLNVKPGFVDTKMTAHLELPTFLTAQPIEVAKAIYKGVKKDKETIYVKGIWRFIMLIIIHIPAFIFKKTDL
ncbi:MAG: SDR family oxidoreductase [Bacteroidota bacterium]